MTRRSAARHLRVDGDAEWRDGCGDGLAAVGGVLGRVISGRLGTADGLPRAAGAVRTAQPDRQLAADSGISVAVLQPDRKTAASTAATNDFRDAMPGR
ncbi:hypothetical protein Pth03_57210 [Planotetraspora thailandica]|uniref:Uncharacterized protein n=1 Tax=Planotetraspora thailandica TaxID=487172 RepID=A0A8J3V4P0_9ACTN|nr:hypothetical protein Pth03_57210 [Planotetraspora thailandica]